MPQLFGAVHELRTTGGDAVLIDPHRADTDLFYRWKDGASEVYRVAQLRWRWLGTRPNGKRHCGASVVVGRVSRLVYIHRLVTEAAPHLVVDHIDRDTSNNMLENLRLATPSQNQANQRDLRPRASKYFGVRCSKSLLVTGAKAFYGVIRRHGKQFNTPHFATEIEAAVAYDQLARQIYGEFARLNFPHETETN